MLQGIPARVCASNYSFGSHLAYRNIHHVRGVVQNVNKHAKLLHCMWGFGRKPLTWIKNPKAFLNEVEDGQKDKTNESIGSKMDVFELVAEDLLTLNKNLRSIVGAEHPVLKSAAEHIFGAGGKKMRPALVFLVSRATAEMTGLRELTEEQRKYAEIAELLHTASLIHDDVLDESDLRRGKKTINRLYSTKVAVMVGDFMFGHSSFELGSLENLEIVKLMSQVIKDLATGEIKQASSLFNCDIQVDEYLNKTYCKTASLMAACAKGAATISGVNHHVANQMHEYGKNLGLSFQVVDDILDFTQSAEQLGKPAGSDLAKGNLTAPVIFALQKEPILRDIINSEFRESGSLEKAIEIVNKCGGIQRAWELARKKGDEAIGNLGCLPESSFRLALEQMVMQNLDRVK